jgi:ribosomal protein S18 acetylase RimI-like enzyme
MPHISRIQDLSPQLYNELIELWNLTGISNPARSDSFDAISHTLENGGMLLCCHKDNKLCGSAWLTHDFRRLYIHHMAVLPGMQNTGIGNLLLQEALNVANSLGYQAKLEVHEDNPAARHLYKKHGFKELDGYLVMINRNSGQKV